MDWQLLLDKGRRVRFASTIKKPRACRRGFPVLPGRTTKGRVGMLAHCAPSPSGGREGLGCNSFPLCSSRRFVNRNLGRSVVSDDGGFRTDFAEYSRCRVRDVCRADSAEGYNATPFQAASPSHFGTCRSTEHVKMPRPQAK